MHDRRMRSLLFKFASFLASLIATDYGERMYSDLQSATQRRIVNSTGTMIGQIGFQPGPSYLNLGL